MSWSASEACARTATPLLRLDRPPFARDPAIDWRWVATLAAAAALLPAAGRRVFLTTGRQGLRRVRGRRRGVVPRALRRAARPEALPLEHELLLDRGPFELAGELALIDRHALDVLVTKDSGGAMTQAKLDAARERGLPVIVVARPPRPDAPTVATVEQALAWLADQAHG